MISATRPALAQGEHARRAGAELRVLIGDVGLLAKLKAADGSALHQAGLLERIRGGLAALDIILRLADQEVNRASASYQAVIQTANDYLDQSELPELEDQLSTLAESYPLYQPKYPTNESSLIAAGNLHKSSCAGCHDKPVQQVSRPAYNLYEQASGTPEIEFYARMLVGVRGDRVTGIDNPLSDPQIAALIAVYRAGEIRD